MTQHHHRNRRDDIVPNLFIVGAAKAATSSLYTILRQHTDIFFPSDANKEPAFFSTLYGMNDLRAYLQLYENATGYERFFGDASTVYLTDPSSANLIYEYNSDARIVIMLRDPVTRAYSLYNWMVQEGFEYSPTFEKALANEKIRRTKAIPNILEPEYYYDYLYFESGLYHAQLKKYFNLFAKENIYICLFEDFVADPDREIKKLLKFLGLEQNFQYESALVNKSRAVTFPFLSFSLRYISKAIFSFYTPKSKAQRDYLIRLTWSHNAPKPMKDATRLLLKERYLDDIARIEQDFNINLRDWK